ncbi:tetratricopeptide repeat protein [[Clostridium] colinum]|uniref:tetratricopeptide repeat protein n=1 Tax=[Clostridium] colinum TaxID=36835 RepID=UPI0020253578|nr:hypothetical protein [[Clostridium] colinum]
MNFIIFKIGFSKYYSGIENTSVNIYDKFYQEKKSNNPEIYNFQDYNDYCYGYASLKSGVVNLSNIKFKNDESILLKNALILWVYEENNKYYLVGWYKNATVYNFLQKKLSYPSVGRDLYYNVKAKAKDCYLLPVFERSFNVHITFQEDTNFYLGNSDDKIYNDICKFINNYNNGFANVIVKNNINSIIENAPENPKTLYKRGLIYLYNESNFLEALKYFNTSLLFKNMLDKNQLTDIYYSKAICLQFLNSFDESLIYFKKVLNNIDYDLNILKNMIYLSIYTKKYKEAIVYCDKILNKEEKTENSQIFLDEICSLKVDCYIYLNDFNNANKVLNDILNTTSSKELYSHCKMLLKQLNNN